MGFAMSTFSIVSSLWGPWNTAAFMAHSFGESRRECIATRRPHALALQREALVERDADDSELLPSKASRFQISRDRGRPSVRRQRQPARRLAEHRRVP